jgi:tRNA nucleotidyltransferase/poly(A) polymerase
LEFFWFIIDEGHDESEQRERVRGEMARVLRGDNVEVALRWMQNTGVSLLVTNHSWVPSTVAQRLGRVPAEWRERVGFAVLANAHDTAGMRRIHPTNDSRLRQMIWEKDLESAFALAHENNVATRAFVRRALLRRDGEGFLHYLSTVTPRKSLAQLLTRDIWTGLKESPVPFDVQQQRQTLVSGDDLIAAGMKPGPVMGAFMGRLELAVIRRDVLTREEALNMVATALDAENR